VVLRGTWGFNDDELVDLVRKVVDAERAFFGDDDFDRFLVTLIPTGTECCSYGGTGLTDSFATFIASNLPVERRMKHLLAHELFHTWNGRRIQRQEPEELVYWFSEGLTDYYANLLSLRAGIVTFPEYVAEYDQTLRTYYLSTARNVPNETVRHSFWEDHAIERIPYQRGDILAHEWSLRIKRATPSASFDDVMRDLFHAAMTDGTVVSATKIDELVRRYLPSGISDDIAHYIDRGDTIVPSADALGPCVKLEQTKIGPFDLGFDEAKSSGSLVGVEPGGPAARAGAKEGMSLRHSRWSNDPTRKVELTVVDGKRERTISYLPQGKPVTVPQYRLDEVAYAKDPAACEAALR
jgi:predicted metalloprotease with PDZ domain